MPKRRLTAREREDISAIAVVETGPHEVHPNIWTDAHFRLIKRAASHRAVETHLGRAGNQEKTVRDRARGQTLAAQDPALLGAQLSHAHPYQVPAGLHRVQGAESRRRRDHGCGAHLAWWYTDEPYAKPGQTRSTGQEETSGHPVGTAGKLPQCPAGARAGGDGIGARCLSRTDPAGTGDFGGCPACRAAPCLCRAIPGRVRTNASRQATAALPAPGEAGQRTPVPPKPQ